MAEIINDKVFDAEKKFVDFAGLDYFWEKAKEHIDSADDALDGRLSAAESDIDALQGVVGDDNSGLVKDVKAIQDELDSLSGGAGSIATQIENAIATLDVEDAAVDGKYVSSVSEVDGKISVTRADLPDFTDAIATAEQNAKDHADGLNTAMDTRVKVLEAIDHEKLASDASAAAVATVLDGAPAKFDTLKEIAAWIAEADTAEDAASLVTRVSALEAIDHDAYKAADTKVLDDAKAYADGLAGNYDATGSAAKALDDAKAYADGLAGNYDAAGSADAAKAAAIAQAQLDAAETLKSYYTKTEADAAFDTKGSADTALTDAKKYTDDTITSLDLANTYEAKGTAANLDAVLKSTLEAYADQAEADAITASNTYAKTYTDLLFDSFKFAGTTDIDTIFNKPAEEGSK